MKLLTDLLGAKNPLKCVCKFPLTSAEVWQDLLGASFGLCLCAQDTLVNDLDSF